MENLILYPTDISQWHALVNEAQVITRLELNEDTESYLVFLLMRFTQTPKLCESVLALDFLQFQNTRQIDLLRDVGDKSLLFCGLFPGMAAKRRVSLTYYSEIGQSAYLTIGELQDDNCANLYFELGNKFQDLQKILTAMRGNGFQKFH